MTLRLVTEDDVVTCDACAEPLPRADAHSDYEYGTERFWCPDCCPECEDK